MPFRHIPYAAQTAPTMSELDDTFADVGAVTVTPCTATGTNSITLTPFSAAASITAYANYALFTFVATNTSTGPVTLQAEALGFLPVYRADGTTQLGSGEIIKNDVYIVVLNLSLNGGLGGWVVISASANGVTPGTYQSANITVDASGRLVSAATGALRSYLSGYILSNDGLSPSRTLNVGAGVATDSTNALSIVSNATINKSIGGTWVSGTGNNGLGAGLTLTSSTWYHTFAIINSGSTDVYFDTTSSGVNQPTNTTSIRRIGSFLTNNASTSGQIGITSFTQNGDEFIWATSVQDINSAQMVSASGTLATLTVPVGVIVNATFRAEITATSGASQAVGFFSPSENDQSVTAWINELFATSIGSTQAGRFNVRTNANAQIRWRGNNTQGILNLGTFGYIDTRGRYF